jgi:hypothetical protein
MPSFVLSREEELYWLALKLVPGFGNPHIRKAARPLPHAASDLPRFAHGIGRRRRERRVAQSIASGITFEDAAGQHDKMAGRRSPRHHGRPALSPAAARDLRSADSLIRSRTRGTAPILGCRRGGHAPAHTLRPGRGGAAVRRSGPRRPHHRQRNGARHRYRGAQRRARRRRRHRRVLGCGVDVVYPAENRKLAAESRPRA